MRFNLKWGAVLTIVAGGLVAGGYMLGANLNQKRSRAGEASVPPADLNRPMASPLGSGMPVPPSHPQITQNQVAGPEPERQGKVTTPDPNTRFSHFRVGNRNVKDILVDGKVVWIGTSGGVIRYDTATDEYRLWDNKTGLLSNGVFHISKLDGRIAIGTYGGGLSILDPAKQAWKNYNVPDGLGDAFVYDVLKTQSGDVWIATWSGVNRVRGGALDDRSQWDLFTVENTQGGLPNDWVYGLAEGMNGEVWMATEGGLARYRNGRWDNWNHAKGLGAPYEKVKDSIEFKNDPAKQSAHHARQKEEMGLQGVDVAYNPNYIVSLAIDGQGRVWAGTWGGGLSRFDGSGWKHYTVAEGLPGNHVFMLHIDQGGRLWIGTNKGLAWMENGKFKILTTADGLFSDTIFSMDTGSRGDLWIGSFGGVTHLRR